MGRSNDALDIGSRRELFADDFLVETTAGGAAQLLHHPTAREAVLTTDAPWEGVMCGYPTVAAADGRHRLYYKGWQIELGGFDGARASRPPAICLAESADGIRWERARVGLFEYGGDRRNNIVWMGAGDDLFGMHGFAPFVDTNPACPPEQRWKAVGAGWTRSPDGLYLLVSPDGVRWSLASGKPFLAGYALDSHNTVLWSPLEGCYRAYFRHWSKGLYDGGRIIMTATSPDCVEWSAGVPLEYPGSPFAQLYTNNVFPYPRAPHIRVGFPARYVEREWSPTVEALPEPDHRRLRSKASPRYGTALSDTLFMAGRDGTTFRRWDEAFIRPGLRAEGSWAYGDVYLAWGMAETASDQPGGGTELSFYAIENYWRAPGTVFRRHTLRTDGFVSFHAPMAGGEFLTRPLVFAGSRLSLNVSTSAAGWCRVGVEDAACRPLEGFAVDDCGEIVGDTLDYTVRWKGGSDVGALAGRPVRLRFRLADADVYSLRFA